MNKSLGLKHRVIKGVNITTIVYLRVLIIEIGSTIILMVVEAQANYWLARLVGNEGILNLYWLVYWGWIHSLIPYESGQLHLQCIKAMQCIGYF